MEIEAPDEPYEEPRADGLHLLADLSTLSPSTQKQLRVLLDGTGEVRYDPVEWEEEAYVILEEGPSAPAEEGVADVQMEEEEEEEQHPEGSIVLKEPPEVPVKEVEPGVQVEQQEAETPMEEEEPEQPTEEKEEEQPTEEKEEEQPTEEKEEEPEFPVKWELEHPKSFVTKEIWDGKKGRMFEVCWHCVSDPDHNRFARWFRSSLESEEALKKDAPELLKRWLRSRKCKDRRNKYWEVKGILDKEVRKDGAIWYKVDWGEDYAEDATWEPKKELEKAEEVAQMIQKYEAQPIQKYGLRKGIRKLPPITK